MVHAEHVFAKRLDAATDLERDAEVRATVLVGIHGVTVAHQHHAGLSVRHEQRAAVRHVGDGAEIGHAGARAGSGTSTKSRCSVT